MEYNSNNVIIIAIIISGNFNNINNTEVLIVIITM